MKACQLSQLPNPEELAAPLPGCQSQLPDELPAPLPLEAEAAGLSHQAAAAALPCQPCHSQPVKGSWRRFWPQVAQRS
jgi:hypothetical protein